MKAASLLLGNRDFLIDMFPSLEMKAKNAPPNGPPLSSTSVKYFILREKAPGPKVHCQSPSADPAWKGPGKGG